MAVKNDRAKNHSAWFQSARFIVRPLCEQDIGPAYQSWFADPVVRKFIRFASMPPTLEALRQYWATKSADASVDFLGIFDVRTGKHIGNVKFELGPAPAEAHVGFLIGEAYARGTGVLREVLQPAIDQLRRRRWPIHVYLTVHPENSSAIGAFERLGFLHTCTMANGDLRMDYGHR